MPTQPTLQRYKVREIFNLHEASEAAEIPGFAPGMPGVPPLDPHYVFDMERMRQFTMFWVGGFRALMIEGDPAAGKTSFLEQIHARLNVPLEKISCGPSTESYQLVGQLLPTIDGTLRYHYGPVARAYIRGTSVLFDEWNTLEPGTATTVNMALEGYELTIPETGEVLRPQKTTRFFVTQNAVDSKAFVAGRNEQDVASDDRFSYMQVDYLDPALEKALVVRHLTAGRIPEDLAKTIAHICVEVANNVRRAFRGDESGSAAWCADIDKPLSTRAVLRWAKYAVMYLPVFDRLPQKRSALHYAIRQAIRMTPVMARAVNEQITLVAGYDEQSAGAAP